MLRRASVVAFMLALGVVPGGAALVAAQGSQPGLGNPITYIDSDGITRGTVTVKDLADPFQDFDPTRPPAQGSRYVELTVAFESAVDQSFDAEPYQVVLQDTDGNLYSTQSVPRPAGVGDPELQGQTMAADNKISGVIGYSIPEAAKLARVVYEPESGRMISLVDVIPASGPALGDKVPYTAADGSSATVTTKIQDPFTDFDPNYPPDAGTRYVELTVAFENVGQSPYRSDPYHIELLNADGHLYYGTNVPRPADAGVVVLESQTLSPGDHVSGSIGFVVPQAAQLTGVEYAPESGRIVLVADLTGGASTPPATTPAPQASVQPPVTATPAPAASAAPVPSAGVAQ